MQPAQVLPRVRDIRRMGVAALDLCHVARGRLDCYYEAGVNAWDIAALVPIIRGAGGVISDWHGGPAYPAESTVAASPR